MAATADGRRWVLSRPVDLAIGRIWRLDVAEVVYVEQPAGSLSWGQAVVVLGRDRVVRAVLLAGRIGRAAEEAAAAAAGRTVIAGLAGA